jgi:uncharacterized protein (TIGR02147 family)
MKFTYLFFSNTKIMKPDIYQFVNYKVYLKELAAELGKGGKSKIAEAAECQSGYISQVLNDNAHLSLEQTERIGSFLGFDELKIDYLLTMVLYSKAGTATLRKYYQNDLDNKKEAHAELKTKFKSKKKLSIEDQAIFYSSWQYGAVHVSVSIPGCETPQGLSKFLNIELKRINEILEFLEKVQLVEAVNGVLMVGSSHIHLSSDSPLISKFHTNWRLQAVQSMNTKNPKDLHYSSVMTCSEADSKKIKEIMTKAIEDIRKLIKESKDEKCFSYAMDLFDVRP